MTKSAKSSNLAAPMSKIIGERISKVSESVDLTAELVMEARVGYLQTLAATMVDELNLLTRRSNDRPPLTLTGEVQRFETHLIRNALIVSFGVQRRAAKILGINPTTLSLKIKRLKIKIPGDIGRAESATTPYDEADTEWPVSLRAAQTKFELHLIERALEEVGGHQSNAAELLQIPLSTLHAKIQKLGIDSTRFNIRKGRKLASIHSDPTSSPQYSVVNPKR